MDIHQRRIPRDLLTRRARLLPVMAVALMLVIGTIFVGHATVETAHAQTDADLYGMKSLTAVSNDRGELTLTWAHSVVHPTDFHIQWAHSGVPFLSTEYANEFKRGNAYSIKGTTTLTLEHLTDNQEYDVRIRTRYRGDVDVVAPRLGPWFAVNNVRVMGLGPDPVTDISSTQTADDAITLSWDAPQDDRITGYNIRRGTTREYFSNLAYDTGNTETEYVDTGLTPGVDYYYTITSHSTDGAGRWSHTHRSRLSWPTVSTVTITGSGSSQLTVMWGAPDIAPTDYRIAWARTDTSFPSFAESDEATRGNVYPAGDVNTFVFDDLTPGAEYMFRVRARYIDEDDVIDWNSPWTNTVVGMVQENAPPTGQVVVNGTFHVGETLTADASSIEDVDGILSELSYQWIRLDADGTNAVNIANTAPFESYVLSDDDAGKRIQVVVTYTDNSGLSSEGENVVEAVTSEIYPLVGTVSAIPTTTDNAITTLEDTSYAFAIGDFNFTPSIESDRLQSVTITELPVEDRGTLVVDGDEIVAEDLPETVAVTDIVVGGMEYAPFLNGHGDAYATFKFKVVGKFDTSVTESTMVINVTSVNDLPTGEAVLSGTPVVGHEITLEADSISDADGVQRGSPHTWERVDEDGSNPVAITVNVPYDSYTLTTDDVGKKIRVTINFVDANSNDESVVSDLFPADGLILNNDPPTASDVAVTVVENRTHVFSLDDFNFVAGTLGDTLRSIKITSLQINSDLTVDGGDVAVGHVITKGQIEAGRMVFTPRNGQPRGDSFGFKVTSTFGLESSTESTMTIGVTSINVPATGSITISDSIPVVGQTVTATAADIADSDGLPDVLATTWSRLDSDGASTLASIATNSNTYVLVDADIGKKIRAEIRFVDDAGNDEAIVSDGFPTNGLVLANDPPTSSDITITTDEDTSYTITTSDFGFTPSVFVDTLVSVQITQLPHSTRGTLTLGGEDVVAEQVITANDIAANRLVFVPKQQRSDVTALIAFKVTGRFSTSADSYGMTINVTDLNVPPTGTPVITGTPRVGYVLTADVSGIVDAEGIKNISYAWHLIEDGVTPNLFYSDTDTYNLIPFDGGKQIQLYIAVQDNEFNQEVLISDPFPAEGVILANVPPTSSDKRVITDEDTAYVFTLDDFAFTANNSDDVFVSATLIGLPSKGTLFIYAEEYSSDIFVTDGHVITPEQIANGDLTFTPASGGRGQGTVDFAFVVNGLYSSSRRHTMTIQVNNVDTLPTGQPVIIGNPVLGETLSADLSGIADAEGIDGFIYHWSRSDADGELVEVAREDETYTLTTDDVGKQIKLGVAVRDNEYNLALLSSDLFPAGGVIMNNLPPTARDSQISTDEDVSYVFTVDDFNFVAVDANDTLQGVQISSLPNQRFGRLFVDDTAAVLAQVVTVDQIIAENFAYVPAPNEYGVVVFNFKVIGNLHTSTSDYTMGVTINSVQDSPTGYITIDGTPLVGETLEAYDTISDPDGVPFGTEFHWFSLDVGGLPNATRIGTNSATYVLTLAEYGKKIKVQTVFTDNGGTTETVTSDEFPTDGTVAVRSAASDGSITIPNNETHIFIAGDFGFKPLVPGNTLQSITITDLQLNGTLTVDGVDVVFNQVITKAEIDNGSMVFTPTAGQSGSGLFRFKVTGSLSLISQSSHAMNLHVKPVNSPTTGQPVITGIPQSGQTVTASIDSVADVDGLPDGFTYQWVRVNVDGTNEVVITNSYQKRNYTLTINDVYKRVFVHLLFDDLDGNPETVTSDPFPPRSSIAGLPSVSLDSEITTGEDVQHVFAASNFEFEPGAPDDSLQGIQITTLPDSGAITLNGDDIVVGDLPKAVTRAELDAGSFAYVPVLNDHGSTTFDLMVIGVVGVSTVEATMTVNITPVNDPATGKPTINGTYVVGETLTASIEDVADVEGLGTQFFYVWYRVDSDGVSTQGVAHTTSGTYTLTVNDVGKQIRVVAFFEDGEGTTESITSGLYPADGTVSGRPPTASDSRVNVEEDVPYVFAAEDFNFVAGQPGEVFRGIKVISTSNNPGTLTLDGADVAVDQVIFDEDITAGKLVFTTESNDHTDLSFLFKVIGTEATGVGIYGMVIVVAPVNDAPVGEPTISGTPIENQTLTTDISGVSDIDGIGDVTFEWIRVDADGVSNPTSAGTDSNSYTLGADDVGKKITVQMNYTDNDGTAELVTSDPFPAEGVITSPYPTSVDKSVTIDEDTEHVFALDDFAFIPGTPGDNLDGIRIIDLDQNQRGRFLFRDNPLQSGTGMPLTAFSDREVKFIPQADDYGFTAGFTFKVSGRYGESTNAYTFEISVSPVQDAAVGQPTIDGETRVGEKLTIDVRDIYDPDGIVRIDSYQWMRVDEDGTSNLTDIGNGRSYTLTSADIGKRIMVEVTFTDNGGTRETVASDPYQRDVVTY